MGESEPKSVLEELHPCWYMRRWVTRSVEGELRGLAGFYSRLHLSRCAQCRKTLEALRALKRELSRLREKPFRPEERLEPRRRQAVEAAWEAED